MESQHYRRLIEGGTLFVAAVCKCWVVCLFGRGIPYTSPAAAVAGCSSILQSIKMFDVCLYGDHVSDTE